MSPLCAPLTAAGRVSSRYSGITATMLAGVKTTLRDVQVGTSLGVRSGVRGSAYPIRGLRNDTDRNGPPP